MIEQDAREILIKYLNDRIDRYLEEVKSDEAWNKDFFTFDENRLLDDFAEYDG